ncbi:quinoprotein glucose dehydrogenase [Aquiflexum balticum DSM 16537]|uniref:Quinoprotein glucose dehydrogenase n=1 Tax=Aquiflexum balticum DSM 16537 TaxID=758820 RepID=A0A1W2H646_9BACT|nr:PQQ-binding-like beta-propeller repeat protein [Aquiflexum balticum]SMD44417.1 quinoprotein glucose dehydrogenase [Aquiflexum balticum DSM 16537]
MSIKYLFRNQAWFLSYILLVVSCSEKVDTAQSQDSQWKSRLNNHQDWGIYRGHSSGIQFSELDQIHTGNVQHLEKVWEYHHGNPVGPGMYANPIIIDGLLYFTTPEVNAVALNAATGKEVWVFRPDDYRNDERPFRGRNRGLTYWEDSEGKNQRILNFVKDRVYAIDAKTGKLITSFGENGWIDLRKNLPQDPEQVDFEATSQGIVYQNFIIIGGRTPEEDPSTPGDVRGYDALTGEFKWIFHTIPQPGQLGYDTWQFEEGVSYGGTNPWGGLTLDEDRGWVFFATGSPAPDFIFGGMRKGENLFANCVVALDATTGKRIWHYQTLRHDIWDYDLPPAPILATVTANGKSRDIVVQLTKQGLTFVLDRETGEPVFPVVDLPVPTSKVPGEEAWPTQPFPLKPPPLNRTTLRESDLSNITPETHEYVLNIFRKHETGPLYTPASVAGVITMPGHQGGAEWGGAAFDPATNVMFVNINEAPTIHSLIPLTNFDSATATPIQRGAMIYNTACTACHGLNKVGNPPLFPPLNDIKLSRDSIKSVLAFGRGMMPAFSHYSDKQLDELVAYLESEDFNADVGDVGKLNDKNSKVPRYANIAPFFVDQNGYPAISPPWGTLNAVDLDKGEILWKVPLGEYPELVAQGIRNTGSKSFGGPVVTAGNLVFIAATPDEKIRAFDKFTGQVLWEYQLPAGGYATPSVYMVGGKQYVVIAAGGGGKNGTKVGDSVIAFALPD